MSRSGVPSRQVEADDGQDVALDPAQGRHACRDRVRPRRRAQRKSAALLAGMPRHLQHEIAPRLVHPIEDEEVRAGLDASQRRGKARVDLQRADGVGFTRVLRALLAPGPRRSHPADEIEMGVELLRQGDRDLALSNAEIIAHALLLTLRMGQPNAWSRKLQPFRTSFWGAMRRWSIFRSPGERSDPGGGLGDGVAHPHLRPRFRFASTRATSGLEIT
jgi:hypothetical protein